MRTEAPHSAEARGHPAKGRLTSLDAFRGATIAAMILVNNPGSWEHVYAPLLHAPWHGWTPTDLIFPFFLFIMGVALPFSFAGRIARGADRGQLLRHAVRRGFVIIGLGLFLSGFPSFDLATIRIPGVLQRIGLVYLVAPPAFLFLSRRGRGLLLVALLLGYWALLMWAPWPGHVPGDLSPDGNLGAFLDRALFEGHLWSQSRTWDPEGLLSTLPAVGTTLSGCFVGERLRGGGQDSTSNVRWLLGWGVITTLIGLAWGYWFPINKNLWTSSYTVFTAGAATLCLAGCYWALDVRGWQRWSAPLVVYGRNALAVFVGSGLLVKVLIRLKVPGLSGDPVSLYSWLYQRVFLPWMTPVRASLAFAAVNVFFWWAVLRWMDHRRLYIKV